MGTIKSKIFDDSTTLDQVNEIDSQKKFQEMTQKTSDTIKPQDTDEISCSSQFMVTNEPKKIENKSIDDLEQKFSDTNISNSNNDNNNIRDANRFDSAGMHSASSASFQPPDFIQRSQYYRSFRSASKRFFNKKNINEPIITFNKTANVSNENASSTKNATQRSYFYRSFKNLNRSNLNCISSVNDKKESYIVDARLEEEPENTGIEMNKSWFKNLKSKSNVDLGMKKKKSFSTLSQDTILEESPKFPIRQIDNLNSKSLNTIQNSPFTVVEIDPSELKNENEIKSSENSSQSSRSSASSTGLFSRTSNGSINNSKSFETIRQVIQIPIKLFPDQQSAKQQHQAFLINSNFLNEINRVNEESKKKEITVERLKIEVDTMNHLIDVLNRDDPTAINELSQKTEDLIKLVKNLQFEINELLKIKNRNTQMNRFKNQVTIKLYEECIIRLDKQTEFLNSQLNELSSIKDFLVHIAAVYNQQTTSNSPFTYSDAYYTSASSEGYYPNYQNYPQRNHFYYQNSRNGFSATPNYYANPSTAYIEQPTAYYYTYRTPAASNLYFDTITGQYFQYRKPHVHPHVHVHNHTHAHPSQFFQAQNGANNFANPFMRGQQNFTNPNTNFTAESPTISSAIVTEVSDDEDDHLRNISDKKKDYVDAISLNGDE